MREHREGALRPHPRVARTGQVPRTRTNGPEAEGPAPVATGPAAEPVGDLAIVLHSHMPYVEGFGTYPFGDDWLFDAVCRSYLPLLEVARDLTMTVSPTSSRRRAWGSG